MASSFIPYSIPNHNRLANTRIYLKVSWPPKKAELSLDAELLITKKDKKNRLAIVTPRENCHQFVSWMHHESKLNWIWLEFSIAFVERNCAQLLNIYMPQRRWILWKRKNRKSFPFFSKERIESIFRSSTRTRSRLLLHACVGLKTSKWEVMKDVFIFHFIYFSARRRLDESSILSYYCFWGLNRCW